MRVCHSIGKLERGGLEILLLDTLSSQNNSGVEFFCVYRKKGSLIDEFTNTNVNLEEISIKSKLEIPNYIKRLRNYLINNKIDIIHVHQPIDAIYAILATKGLEIKIVISMHGYDTNSPILNSINTYVFKRVNKILFVSNSLMNYYANKYSLNELKCKLLYNGVSLNRLLVNKSSSIRQEKKIPNDTFLLGMTGNFYGSGRNQLTVLKGFKIALEKHSNMSLMFIGGIEKNNPEYLECLSFCNTNKLNNKVQFLGSRKDIPNILDELNLFVYASNHDSFGIAVIEAVLKNIPVIINDIPVFKEISNDGEFAHLYHSKNVTELSELIIKAKEDKTFRTSKVENAYKYALGKFTIQRHLESLNKIYSSLN